jgi:ABC-type multidrug transport system ATPase subunit
MKGYLTVCQGPEEPEVYELVKEQRISLGGGSGNSIQAGKSAPPQVAFLEWQGRAASWSITPGEGAEGKISLNRQHLPTAAFLRDQDIIELPDAILRFDRRPDAPLFQGHAATEITLGQQALVLGRASTTDKAGAEAGAGEAPGLKVELDKEDSAISRAHARIAWKSGRHWITDTSRSGTLLNGQPFQEERLVVGDRFRIGSYNFEYTGRTIRLVDNVIGGKVEARNLHFTVKGRNILDEVSLDIAPCSFVGILGGSGQGKSTLMNALCGVNPATAGEVYLNGRRLDSRTDLTSAGIGYVPQDDIVHSELTVLQAVTYSARLRLDPRTPKANVQDLVLETIKRLGLQEHMHKRISNLSGGQRKRVSIATELLDKPSMLFLDEPSSGLDPATEFSLMSMLRQLAATDCTVICTTHVLGRAYLFDRLMFIQQGRLVFDGPPSEAMEHFGVQELDRVYQLLAEPGKTGVQWEEEFRQRTRNLDPATAVPPLPAERVAPRKRRPGYLNTLPTLFLRQWAILKADPLNLVFLLAQPLVIGFLVSWVAENVVLRMFLTVISTLWFGCSNGAQQIVREAAIYRRERVCGQGRHAYVQSKYAFLTGITCVQAALLFLTVTIFAHAFHPKEFVAKDFRAKFLGMAGLGPDENPPLLPVFSAMARFLDVGTDVAEDAKTADGKPYPLEKAMLVSVGLKLGAMLSSALVGVAIGLAISALVQTNTQAVMWVPLVLIPQILFGSFVVTLPEMSKSVRTFCQIVPSFAAQRMMDVGNVFGHPRPLLTNTTKYPAYLTGEMEKIEWDGKKEEYDQVSPHNISWQNLITDPAKVGQREKELRSGLRGISGLPTGDELRKKLKYNKLYETTTTKREDVRQPTKTTYLDLRPAYGSAAVVAGWVVVCYALTLLGLRGKEKGK